MDVTDGITLFDPVETWKKRTFTNVRAERLNRPIYVNGKRVYENPPLRDIRDFCAAQVATLWDEVTRFEKSPPLLCGPFPKALGRTPASADGIRPLSAAFKGENTRRIMEKQQKFYGHAGAAAPLLALHGPL